MFCKTSHNGLEALEIGQVTKALEERNRMHQKKSLKTQD
jgi:hypothetical protein